MSATFTATSINGGSNPIYQWFLNGTPQSTGPSFTTPNLTSNASVYCTLTSDLICASPSTVNSSSSTVTVSTVNVPTPSYLISYNTDSIICFKNQSTNASSVFWNFGDPNSIDNTSVYDSPCHKFSAPCPASYIITLTAYGICDNSASNTIQFPVCAGPTDIVEPFSFKSLDIIPNPTSDILNIYCTGVKNGDYEVLLYDIVGQLLINKSFGVTTEELTAQLYVRDLTEGIYVLRIRTKDGAITKMIYKQE